MKARQGTRAGDFPSDNERPFVEVKVISQTLGVVATCCCTGLTCGVFSLRASQNFSGPKLHLLNDTPGICLAGRD